MSSFNKRIYRRPRDLWTDLSALFHLRRAVSKLSGDSELEPAFRERLMLAVTAVNQCRYCSYVHTRLALRNGLSETEVRSLLDSSLSGAPAAELPAILFAHHWAESDGIVAAQDHQCLIDIYGEEKSQVIQAAIQTMRLANLLGNTFEYVFAR